jgi:hypothetical protein
MIKASLETLVNEYKERIVKIKKKWILHECYLHNILTKDK